jgi:hypothetical protein
MHVAGGSLDWVPHRDEDVDLRSVTGLFPSKPSLPNGRRRTKGASSFLRSVHLGSGLTLIFSVSALMFLFYQRSALSADGRWVETGVSQRGNNESLEGRDGFEERNSRESFLEGHTAVLIEKGFLGGGLEDAGTRGDESESESGGLADAANPEDEFDGESGFADQSDTEFNADQHMLFVDGDEEKGSAEVASGSTGQSGQVNGTVVGSKQERFAEARGKQKSRSSRADRLTAEVAALDGNGKGKDAREGSAREGSAREGSARTDVMLVTGVEARPCTTRRGSEIALKGLKNKIDYAR